MDISTTLIYSAPLTVPLIVGYLLDLVFGDPYHWPHPVKLFGHLINQGEKWLNKGKNKILKGAITTILLVTLVWTTLALLFQYIEHLPYFYYPTATILVFWGLAHRNLIDEAIKVDKALTKQGIESARRQLSFIVGRDTSQLTPTQIRTAVLETLSENLSDGVIAPILYYLIGGIPLMFAYKMINTLDSMIGYKNSRYIQFGKFAARLDDVVNYIPARITALLMIVVTMSARGLKFVVKYGHQHASPNSGYPESALAGILNCRFGGPNIYQGQITEKPFIGQNTRAVTQEDLKLAVKINQRVTLLAIVLTISALIL